ncbi:hypothetical protein DAEQUDRAFT_672681 [Daedalea quercina L-15889]|uniref:Uncharacterized protein n=1 Tax=Daedalea quercina L-15889 TaxID=1314783 RepID=A0A165P2U6_9APHY|nr:hypothetical protein DAEQUDRAFT_672681 [Daedalea quercina L-15889]
MAHTTEVLPQENTTIENTGTSIIFVACLPICPDELRINLADSSQTNIYVVKADLEEDSDDTESASESSEDDPLVENPSQDIRGDLEKVLEGDLAKAFKGSYSFSRSYPDAPNPGLYLLPNDIRTVGLPLSERDAEAVRSGCRQAPFGQGERTVVDPTVRDVWEMDANQVQFRNPAWNGFLQGVVDNVCAELGVNVAVSKPRCEHYKLLLYETGSHFLPHVDTEKVNGMFATIVVVLPSKYTGGAAHLSHGSLSAVYDTASLSEIQTTALAWYTDVMHEIKPITSGYRLALSYNLLHTSNALRPSLPDNQIAVNILRHVLLSWKQEEYGKVPRKILYLLDHKYSQANLKGSALSSVDAHKSAMLNTLAKEHGFRLGIANLECRLSGYADDDGGHYCDSRNRWGYDLDSDGDSDNVGFAEVENREASITNLVTVGIFAQIDELDFDEESDGTIPNDLIDTVESGPHDGQEYEGYMDNGAGSLERWYRRTVLVIWPRGSDMDMTFEGDIFEAIEELARVESSRPHKRERKHVDFLLDVAKNRPEHRTEIAEILFDAACTWKDTGLYERVITACGPSAGVRMIGNNVIFRSIEALGVQLLHPILQKMLRAERSNFLRFQFIDEPQNRFSAQPSVRDGGVDAWITEQRRYALEHLEKPGSDDGEILVDLALRNGGYHVLRDIFVPQLSRIPDPNFLLDFANSSRLEKLRSNASIDDQNKIDKMCIDVLSAAVRQVDFYKAKKYIMVTASLRRPMVQKDPDATVAFAYFEACVETGNDPLVEQLVDRFTDTAPPVEEARSHRHKELFLEPFLTLVEQKLKTRPADAPTLPSVVKLYETVLQMYFRSWHTNAAPTKDELAWLIEISTLCGGIDFLERKVWPGLSAGPVIYTENSMKELIDLLRLRAKELPPAATGSSVASLTSKIVRRVIERANLEADIVKTLELLSLCQSTDSVACYPLVFKRLLAPPSVSPEYVEFILVPFIPELRDFLADKGLSPSDEPFSAVFKSILMLWANHVLGTEPHKAPKEIMNLLQTHNCKCTRCTSVFEFLLNGLVKTHRLHCIGAKLRKHVEAQLSRYARRCATWQTIQSSPQGLLITRDDVVYRPAKWKAAKAQIPNILASIAPDAEQLQKILGADYQVIMSMLGGHVPVQDANAPVPPSQTATAARHTASAVKSARAPKRPAPASQSPKSKTTSRLTKRKRITYDPTDVIDLTSD